MTLRGWFGSRFVGRAGHGGAFVRLCAVSAAVGVAACAGKEPAQAPILTADPPVMESGATAADGAAATEVERGLAHIKNENYAQAKASFQKAIALKPTAAAWAYLGLTNEKTNDRPSAETAYKNALKIDPAFADAAQNLGALYLDEPARADDAIAVLQPAVEKNPGNAQLLQNLAFAHGLKHDVETASKLYAAALTKGEDAQLRFAWGTLLFEHKQPEKAAEQLKKALAAAKDDAPLLVSVGRLLGPTKAYAECVSAFDRALKIKATDPEWFVRRGTCRHELKDEEGAQADYEAAVKVNPKFAPAHYYLGLSYLAQKRRMNGTAELEKAVTLGAGTNIAKVAKEKLNAIPKK